MATNQNIITDAYRMGNIIPMTSAPSAELGSAGLRHLNDMMATWAGDRIDLGWFNQDDLSAEAPVADDALQAIKSNLCVILTGVAGMDPPGWVLALASKTYLSLLRTAAVDALEPANMDHMPPGSGFGQVIDITR